MSHITIAIIVLLSSLPSGAHAQLCPPSVIPFEELEFDDRKALLDFGITNRSAHAIRALVGKEYAYLRNISVTKEKEELVKKIGGTQLHKHEGVFSFDGVRDRVDIKYRYWFTNRSPFGYSGATPEVLVAEQALPLSERGFKRFFLGRHNIKTLVLSKDLPGVRVGGDIVDIETEKFPAFNIVKAALEIREPVEYECPVDEGAVIARSREAFLESCKLSLPDTALGLDTSAGVRVVLFADGQPVRADKVGPFVPLKVDPDRCQWDTGDPPILLARHTRPTVYAKLEFIPANELTPFVDVKEYRTVVFRGDADDLQNCDLFRDRFVMTQ